MQIPSNNAMWRERQTHGVERRIMKVVFKFKMLIFIVDVGYIIVQRGQLSVSGFGMKLTNIETTKKVHHSDVLG